MTYLYLTDGSIFDVEYSLLAGLVFGVFLMLRFYLICRDAFGRPKE